MVIFVLCVSVLIYLNTEIFYRGPVISWSEIKSKIENEFSNNKDLQNSALQMAFAIQRGIESPEDAKDINPELLDALSCVYATLELQKLSLDETMDMIDKIRDLSVSNNPKRVKKYIKFNANLSGGVYPLAKNDTTKCKFKIGMN